MRRFATADLPSGDRRGWRRPAGPRSRPRGGSPEGVLHEAATRLVTVHVPPPTADDLEAALIEVGRTSSGSASSHATIPAASPRTPIAGVLVPGLRPPVRAGPAAAPRPCVHARRRARDGARRAACAAARVLGADPEGRATVGWQKCFADGSLGSRTAALLARHRARAGPPAPARAAARRLDDRARRPRASASSVRQPAGSRRRSTRSAMPRSGPRSTCSSRARRPPVDAPHRARPAARSGRSRPVRGGRHRGQRPAGPSRVATPRRPASCGATAPRRAATRGAIARHGRRHAVRDRRAGRAVRPVARPRAGGPPRGPALAGGHAAFAPEQSLTLDRALRAALHRPARSRRARLDRGRLTVGQRADVVVIPAASIDEPVDAGRRRCRRPARDGPARRPGRLRDLAGGDRPACPRARRGPPRTSH